MARKRNTLESGEDPSSGMVIVRSSILNIPEEERANCFKFARRQLETAKFELPEIMTSVLGRFGPKISDADFTHHTLAVYALEESGKENLTPDDFKRTLEKVRAIPLETLFWSCCTLRDYQQDFADVDEWIRDRTKTEYEAYSIERDDEKILDCFTEQVLAQHPSFCRPNLTVLTIDDLEPRSYLAKVLAMVVDKRDRRKSFFEEFDPAAREANFVELSFRELLGRFTNDKDPDKLKFT